MAPYALSPRSIGCSWDASAVCSLTTARRGCTTSRTEGPEVRRQGGCVEVKASGVGIVRCKRCCEEDDRAEGHSVKRSYCVRDNPSDREAEGRTFVWVSPHAMNPSSSLNGLNSPSIPSDSPSASRSTRAAAPSARPPNQAAHSFFLSCIGGFLLLVSGSYVHVVLVDAATHQILRWKRLRQR